MHFAFRSGIRCAALALWLGALPAFAEDCPDGDWFCEPAAERPGAPAAAPATPQPSAPTSSAEAAPQQRGSVTLAHADRAPRERRPRLSRRSSLRRFAADLHAFGVILRDGDADPDAGMGGIGAGLRYRPIPHFALDGSLELGLGTDYNGFDRREGALLASAVGFVNPQSVLALYAITGLNLAVAEVTIDASDGLPVSSHDERYRYFGMHLGAGVEARVSRRAAVRAELLGFVRARTDADRDERPEFVDPETHRATNTSGGGLVRVGALFYF